MSGGKHFAKGSLRPQLPDDGILRVYSMRFCPYAQRVHLVLNAKKIPYHTVFINLTDKPEWLVEVSSSLKVPALELPKERGTPSLIESLIIAEYLEEKYPEVPLYPKDPLKKAQDKILIQDFNNVTDDFVKMVLSGAEGAQNAITLFFNGLQKYEKELQERGTPYFGGEAPGMLDYMIWPWIERLAIVKFFSGDKVDNVNEFKKRLSTLLNWRKLMLSDPAVKGFYVDDETHIKFLQSRLAGKTDYDILA